MQLRILSAADVRAAMPDDGIICLDNGMYKIWFARNYRAYQPNTILLDNALATMGAGLPSAIGASFVYPDRKILAIAGDGGFMMNSQELETAVRMKWITGDVKRSISSTAELIGEGSAARRAS